MTSSGMLPLIALASAVVCADALTPSVLQALQESDGATRLRAAVPAPALSYEGVYDDLMALRPDPSRVASVRDLVLERDAARFTLREGQIHLLSPVAGRTIAALFVGDGVFTMEPPTPVEREQLARSTGGSTVEQEFETLFLLFADGTLGELEGLATFEAGTVDRNAEREIEEALEYLGSDDDSKWFDPDVVGRLLNGREDGFFYAHFAENRGDPFFFGITPTAAEEIWFGERADGAKRPALLSNFHSRADYEAGVFERIDSRDEVHLGDFEISSTVNDDLDFSARASFDIRGLEDDVSWVRLVLYSGLMVDAVRTADGDRVEFFRAPESSSLWLHLDPAMMKEETRRLTVLYRGDLLEWTDMLRSVRIIGVTQSSGWMVRNKSSTFWFPRIPGRQTAAYDLTFSIPDKYRLTSVGQRLESGLKDGVRTSRWTAEEIRNVTFNLGVFEEYHFEDPNIPPVTLHVAEEMHRNLVITGPSGERIAFDRQNDMEEVVGSDLRNSLSFFSTFFGPPLVDHFYATEIPYAHGEAYLGMVMLSWFTFQWSDREGGDEIFRSHEVAHQWWGIGVDFATYRDQWISEGFSQFAGLWYMQLILQQNDLYFEALEEWRKTILDRQDEAGPISLGFRNASAEHPEDYQTIVYNKGAWVLHMLRNLLLDLDTLGEDRFQEMMRDFYLRYRGKRATTADFAAVVEEHVGIPMDWFFDQWVDGTAIPTYRFSHTGDTTEDGKYRMRVRVAQENVPAGFKMYVPILLDFGDEGWARVRVLVEGPLTEVELPMLPRKPDEIVFNDLESVLADVKNERWRN